ncbi:MAG: potassium transporter [Sandaracinus sp.]|nr:potassium transporter [Sandaracinus sp.]|tara:strand:- start:2725 stop:3666 length:942 start_codon:yes stop_codon:yes gene_type:complete
MIKLFKTVAESNLFQNFITGVILFAGALVGLETYPSFHERYEPVLHVLDQVVLWIFVGEIIIKMVAELPRPWRYFYDGWNVFDFLIVAGAFLPFAAQYATVLRLLRLLRVLKLVRALPKLQMLVGALLKSIPSMAYVSLLLMMLFYVYAVAATFMWGHNDPVHFGNLQMSFLSLFRAVTLEDWTDLMYIQMYGCEGYGYGGMEQLCVASEPSPVGGAVFFVSFVLFGTMIFLNLFIGVILNGMDEAQREAAEEAQAAAAAAVGDPRHLDDELRSLTEKLGDLQLQIARIQKAASGDDKIRTLPIPGTVQEAAE